MQFTWTQLIDRARVYLDDDHAEQEGWIAPATWLTLANVEYAQLYRRWVRMGLVAPAWVDDAFTGYTRTVTGVLAILGVAENLGGGQVRIVTPAQSTFGRSPFWGTSSSASSASQWQATGSADSLLVTLEPQDASGNYFIRYIPTVPYATLATATIDLPYGGDERMVLGIARRAKLKEGSASRQLDGAISEIEAELAFTAFGRANDSPRVRRVARTQHAELSADPAAWRFV